MKILVIQQKMIGDVLVSSLICENLKQNNPAADIHYLVNKFCTPVIENNPFIDKIIVYDNNFNSDKWVFIKLLKTIRRQKYDVVIDAYGKLESNLITFFSNAKVKISWKKSCTKMIYTSTVKINRISKSETGAAIENRLQLVKAFNNSGIFTIKPKIYLTEDELQRAKENISQLSHLKKPSLIMISALGSQDNKTYPLKYMAKVLNFIVENTSATLILNFIPHQKNDIETLYNLCNERTKNHIEKEFYPENLRDFLATSKLCKAIIGNEGGSINMGKALEVPTFSIFSPWIQKEGWNSFENSSLKHSSAHLSDYKPELLKSKIKERIDYLYQEFEPELFLNQLKLFLVKNVN